MIQGFFVLSSFISLLGYFSFLVANRDADSKTSCFTLSDAVSLMDRYSILVFL